MKIFKNENETLKTAVARYSTKLGECEALIKRQNERILQLYAKVKSLQEVNLKQADQSKDLGEIKQNMAEVLKTLESQKQTAENEQVFLKINQQLEITEIKINSLFTFTVTSCFFSHLIFHTSHSCFKFNVRRSRSHQK